jgi:SAM-dependent methyltransferase
MPPKGTTSDAERWDQRYADAPVPTPTAPEALAGLDIEVPYSGRAVDVACGTGAQTLWLAERGLEVVAIDVSPRAIEVLTLAAQSRELSSRIDARTVSLDHGLPGDLADVDVLVCQRFRDPTLYDPFVRAVRPGGIGIVTVLSAVGLGGEPGPFHAPPADLSAGFDRLDTELLLDVEADGVASVVFRRR